MRVNSLDRKMICDEMINTKNRAHFGPHEPQHVWNHTIFLKDTHFRHTHTMLYCYYTPPVYIPSSVSQQYNSLNWLSNVKWTTRASDKKPPKSHSIRFNRNFVVVPFNGTIKLNKMMFGAVTSALLSGYSQQRFRCFASHHNNVLITPPIPKISITHTYKKKCLQLSLYDFIFVPFNFNRNVVDFFWGIFVVAVAPMTWYLNCSSFSRMTVWHEEQELFV